MADEFDLINSIQTALAGQRQLTGSLPVSGDDCAVLAIHPDKELAVSSDIYLAGVHFPANLDGTSIAQHCLSAALSDLAATGAKPLAMTLAVSAKDSDWIADLIPGCVNIVEIYDLALVGGDLSCGPESLCVTVMGEVDRAMALSRAGAKPDDDIWLSGYTGEAAAGLRLLQDSNNELSAEWQQPLIKRFCLPDVRIHLGLALIGVASAAIDVSDGLQQDLGHLLKASKVGAYLYPEAVLTSRPLQEFLAMQPTQTIDFTLQGGDDYELCFTTRPGCRTQLAEISNRLGVPLSRIGKVQADQTIFWPEGTCVATGYKHFGT